MSETGRPTCVTVISWVWISLGAFWCLWGAVAQGIWLGFGKALVESPNLPADFPVFMMRLFAFASLVALVVGPVALAAGIQLLHLRSWARTVLEGLSWLLLAFAVGWGVLNACAPFSSEIRRLVGMGNVPEPLFAPILVAFAGIGTVVFYGGLLAIMLRYLRGQTVRDALKHVTRTPA